MNLKLRISLTLLGLAVFGFLVIGSMEEEVKIPDDAEFAKLTPAEKDSIWREAVLPKEDREIAYRMAEKFVKDMMPTPSSVDFKYFSSVSKKEEHANKVRVSSFVFEYKGNYYREYSVHTTFDAGNRYGAIIRYDLNVWLYQRKESWSREAIFVTDASLNNLDPHYRVIWIDSEDLFKVAKMPEGWVPSSLKK